MRFPVFTVARVQYPELQTADVETGKRILLNLTTGGSFTFNLATATDGDYTTSLAPGVFSISQYSIDRSSFRLRRLTTHRARFQATITSALAINDPNNPDENPNVTGIDANLDFNDATLGSASCVFITGSERRHTFSSTFVISELP